MLTEDNIQDIFEIADLLSNGDRELFLQLREVVFASDPNYILDLLESVLSPEAFDAFLDRVGESEKDNLLVILLALLAHNQYICVRPPKERLSDFIETFDRLQTVRRAGISLKLDSNGLEPEKTLAEWADAIDKKFTAEQFCLGALEMSTDSLYLFFGKAKHLERVIELFINLGYRAAYAKNM
ncbi:TPA: DUF6630 family protein [Streptococcus suis]